MSVLKSLESRLAGLVEGTFSRAFRSEVRPVEIARKLAREMEEHKSISVSRVYVPNEYAVYLSPQDRERFEGYEEALTEELAGYLLEHARSERFALVSRPVVEFRTDERLSLGEFGIQARLVQPPEKEEVAPRQAERGNTMIYSTAGRVREPLEERTVAPAPRQGMLLLDGRRIVLGPAGRRSGARATARSSSTTPTSPASTPRCSRTPPTDGWAVADLGSTNGTKRQRPPRRRAHAPRARRPHRGWDHELRFELE